MRRWSLAAKLAFLGVPLVVLALVAIVVTLWVSFQLDGGAAALNEAGRMRMQAYRLSLSVAQGARGEIKSQVEEFDRSLTLLRSGNPARPLAVPWNSTSTQQFALVEERWAAYAQRWTRYPVNSTEGLAVSTHAFVDTIDAFVHGVEERLAGWTSLLHLLHTGVLAMFIIWVVGLLVGIYTLVLEPLGALHRAMGKVQSGDWNARVAREYTLEFDDLAHGFNNFAEHLQNLYRDLERKVQEKTSELQDKHERLEQLYGVTALVGQANNLDDLAHAFTRAVQQIAKADGVALRWSDQANERYLILASSGLPQAMVEAENCLDAGECYCGRPSPNTGMVVIPIHTLPDNSYRHCERAGFGSIYSVPIQMQDRLLGEVNFFFRKNVQPTDAERTLLEALNSQLATAMENLRHTALEREEAVSGERHHLSRELHDSIAQSLAFLKIQVNLLRDAVKGQDRAQTDAVVDEIDAGVRECYGDVRELLMHFRTRTNTEDIIPALETTLRKFEHQTGVRSTLEVDTLGVPLPADVQIQVLHILQEALSNVRKHARASQVWLRVQGQPLWRFEVRDDGLGFDSGGELGETHVGLGIMSERAQRIGAQLQIDSSRHSGTCVQLVLSRS
jgi:two-component system nitrate/nitrite sensor histidine kinase NarX